MIVWDYHDESILFRVKATWLWLSLQSCAFEITWILWFQNYHTVRYHMNWFNNDELVEIVEYNVLWYHTVTMIPAVLWWLTSLGKLSSESWLAGPPAPRVNVTVWVTLSQWPCQTGPGPRVTADWPDSESVAGTHSLWHRGLQSQSLAMIQVPWLSPAGWKASITVSLARYYHSNTHCRLLLLDLSLR